MGTTKQEMIETIAATENISKAKAGRIIGHLLSAVHKELHYGEGRVRISGLGTFRLKQVAARKQFSPTKATVIDIPARTRIAFKASPAIKDPAYL